MLPAKTISRRRTGRQGRGGRPRAADVEKLNQNILATAGELFLQHGFDGTSMDAIAETARISKRTLYSRYEDKSALFNTAIYDLLGRFLVPVETIQYEPGDLGSALLAIGRDMVTGVVRPEFLAIYRLVTFEAQRRPEFGRWINDARRRPAVQTIAGVLKQHQDELRVTDFDRAAEQFMSLTVDVALRLGAFGYKTTTRESADGLQAAVDLFLNGARRDDRPENARRRGKTPSGRT